MGSFGFADHSAQTYAAGITHNVPAMPIGVSSAIGSGNMPDARTEQTVDATSTIVRRPGRPSPPSVTTADSGPGVRSTPHAPKPRTKQPQ